MTIESGKNIGAESQPREKLFTVVDGLVHVRQLTPPEIEDLSTLPVIETPEGFKIRGTNDSRLVRGLTGLTLMDKDGELNSESTDIMALDQNLKRHNIIGNGESFNGLVTHANDDLEELNKIHKTNITHQKLAGFLMYFEEAFQQVRETDEYKSLPIEISNKPLLFDLNGRTYLWNRESRQRMGLRRQARGESPFEAGKGLFPDRESVYLVRDNKNDPLIAPPDPYDFLHTFEYCLDGSTGKYIETGKKQINFNPQLPGWIYRFGFYGGRDIKNNEVLENNSEFRLTPTEIADLAGFIPPAGK